MDKVIVGLLIAAALCIGGTILMKHEYNEENYSTKPVREYEIYYPENLKNVGVGYERGNGAIHATITGTLNGKKVLYTCKIPDGKITAAPVPAKYTIVPTKEIKDMIYAKEIK